MTEPEDFARAIAASPSLLDGEGARAQAQRLIDARSAGEKLAGAYRHTFSSPESKIVLADLARQGCIFAPTTIAGREAAAENEGGRLVVLRIFAMLGWRVDLEELYRLAQPRTEGDTNG